jgi:hypothetical protein
MKQKIITTSILLSALILTGCSDSKDELETTDLKQPTELNVVIEKDDKNHESTLNIQGNDDMLSEDSKINSHVVEKDLESDDVPVIHDSEEDMLSKDSTIESELSEDEDMVSQDSEVETSVENVELMNDTEN